jgi:hypothetical protein
MRALRANSGTTQQKPLRDIKAMFAGHIKHIVFEGDIDVFERSPAAPSEVKTLI